MRDVSEIFIRSDRFYVRFVDENEKIVVMPRANYAWLKSNPSFLEIPKRYSVHHLDLDQTNDDPSNLTIMQKHLHTAYHWKHKRIKTPIKMVRDDKMIIPKRKPSVLFNKERQRYYLSVVDGSCKGYKRRRIYNDKSGNGFRDKASALAYLDKFWSEVLELGGYVKK